MHEILADVYKKGNIAGYLSRTDHGDTAYTYAQTPERRKKIGLEIRKQTYLSDGIFARCRFTGRDVQKKCAFRAFVRTFLVKYYFFTLLKTAAF